MTKPKNAYFITRKRVPDR